MYDRLKELAKYCVGTAESEEGLGCVERIYVEPGIVQEIRDMPEGAPRLVVGHKGNGKTLVFSALKAEFEHSKIDVLYVTPSDIVAGSTPSSEDPGVLKAFYFHALVRNVAVGLGRKLTGLVSGADTTLLREALDSGAKDHDLIERCLYALSSLGMAVAGKGCERKVLNDNLVPKGEVKTLVGAIDENLRKAESKFYLFVDEPDEVGTEGSAAARMWGLLNACQEISKKLKNIRCVVSLRTEMWHLLMRSPAGSKNIDHFSPLVLSMDSSTEQIRSIVQRRLTYVAKRLNLFDDGVDPYSIFFEGESTELPPPAKDEHRAWKDYLVKSARERPRDAIQFIRMLAEHAIKDRREKISSLDVLACAAKFSEDRLSLLVKEYATDFPDSIYVYKEFAKNPFALPAEKVKSVLDTIIGYGHVRLRGKNLVRTDENDVFTLWKMLHETGFLNPYVLDDRRKKEYRHVSFADDMTLVSMRNFSKMCGYMWEIHPAYRSYMYTLQDDEIHRVAVLKERSRIAKSPNYFQKKRFRR